MNANATGLAVLLLLAVACNASAQRRGIITCSCPMGNGRSQQGKLLGSVCYVVGVGSCRSFTYEGTSQPQRHQKQHQQQYEQQQQYQQQYEQHYKQQYQQQQQQQQPQPQQPQPQQQFSGQRHSNQQRFPFRSGFQSRFDTNRPARFGSSPTNTRLNQFNRRHQFSSSAPADTSRAVSRFSPHRPGRFDLAAAAATASPEQQRSAAEETRRQLESRRTFERELAESGVTVRPGSPEAAQASERRPDDKSADLGNKALAQILYLQSLLGRSGRR